mmetsp:Transcript_42929/g.69650  ORF Transcript_42929/g.69650 Transcript_42929/m.69650 type:complete len:171 (+) Transcript_42929:139-651(+)
MIVYRDALSNDEMIADSFAFKLVDNIAWEVQGKFVNVDVGDINIGQNASTEAGEEDESVEDSAVKVVNIVHSFRLVETSYTKPQFMAWFKAYLKKIKDFLTEKNPGRVESFQTEMQAYAKNHLLPKFNDLQFFTGESCNPEAGMAFAYYPEGSSEPTFIFFKDGLIAEKV